MGEVEMAATATSTAFYGRRHIPVLLLEAFEGDVATMVRIDIEHDDPGDTACDNSDPRVGPARQPRLEFRSGRSSVLKFLPAYEWAFVATTCSPTLIHSG
jgi:hypothetical protein